MTSDQDKQIQLGKDLWLLSNSVLFIPYKNKLNEMIADLEDEEKRWDPRSAGSSLVLPGIKCERRGLEALRTWMQEEIDLGAELLKKKEMKKVTA